MPLLCLCSDFRSGSFLVSLVDHDAGVGDFEPELAGDVRDALAFRMEDLAVGLALAVRYEHAAFD